MQTVRRHAVSLELRGLCARFAGGLKTSSTADAMSAISDPALPSRPMSKFFVAHRRNLIETFFPNRGRYQRKHKPHFPSSAAARHPCSSSPRRSIVSLDHDNIITRPSYFDTGAITAGILSAPSAACCFATTSAAAAAASASASPTSFSTVTRTEVDLLGPKQVPSDALYGISTQRAVENFDITGVRLNHFPEFIKALGMTKKARARLYNARMTFISLGHVPYSFQDF